MKIKRYINKFLSFTGYSIKKIKAETIKLESLPEIPVDEYQYIGDDLYFLNLLDLKINIKKFNFLIRGYQMAKLLKLNKKAIFEINNDHLICEIDKMKCFICTWEELLILKEIYINGIYNYYSLNKSVLIDIGMNVGLTSLFYANKYNFKQIYAYEPFRPTFDLAHDNFKLNLEISKKIISFNYGLGSEYKKLNVPYDFEYKGSMGINGLPSHIKIDNNNVKLIDVEIRPIIDEMNKIIIQHGNDKIVAKIDCEGAEYEIIEKLSKENLLNKLSVIMMEWHKKGPNYLIELLIKSEFEVFSFDETDSDIGMIYALNKTNK